MPQINIRVSHEIKAQMAVNSHINWSELVRDAIVARLSSKNPELKAELNQVIAELTRISEKF